MALVNEIQTQGLTPERATLLFGMMVGPLPGVTVPPGSGDPGDFDGTLAVTYLARVWNALTPAQRDAATKLIDGPTPGPTPHVATNRRRALVVPAAYVLVDNPDVSIDAFNYNELGEAADAKLAEILHVDPVKFTIDVNRGKPPGIEYAHTWSWYASNMRHSNTTDPDGWDVRRPSCEIVVNDQRFWGLNGNAVDAQSIVVHEMFHCYQQRTEDTARNALSLHDWIAEGEATWVQFTVEPGADIGDYMLKEIGGIWAPYIKNPTTIYAHRSYDAVGVFGHLSDLTGSDSVWPKLLPLVLTGIGGNDDSAFHSLVADHEIDYYNRWGASYFQDAGHGPWKIAGPGQPPTYDPSDGGPNPTPVTVDAGTAEMLPSVGPDQSAIYTITGSADIVTVSLMEGYGRVHDEGFGIDKDLDSSDPLVLCLKQGGCKCPDGSEGASLFTTQAAAPISVGINGGDTNGTLGVAGDTLDHFCKQPDPNLPPAPPSQGGGPPGGGGGSNEPPPPPPASSGTAWGDTHLWTFDGLGYDFQVVGEYTLVRSTKDAFAVQVRQVPALGPKVASVIQSVATAVGSTRITFTMENGSLLLRVDGRLVSGEPPALHGASLTGTTTAYGGTYRLTWADGTRIHVEQLGSIAMNVTVTPAASRRGTLVGLLGNFDGSRDDDLVGAGGAKLGVGRDDVNGALADAWRIASSASLFDYAAGQSSASFTDPDFPAKDADAARLANYATAEKTCRAHGITDERLLNDCILDLAVTNGFVFGSRYAHEQQVLAVRAAHTGAVASRPILWMDGEVTAGQPGQEVHFDGKKGEVIFGGRERNCQITGPDPYTVRFSLLDPSGKSLTSKVGCDLGRFELPATGRYTYTSQFSRASGTAHYHVPVRFARPDRVQPVVYGQTVSGRIDQRAAHDLYTWTGKAGDLIVLSGPGCDLGHVLTAIIGPDGSSVLGPGCRVGTFWKLQKDGPHTLVINSDECGECSDEEMDAPGPYHFVFQGGTIAH